MAIAPASFQEFAEDLLVCGNPPSWRGFDRHGANVMGHTLDHAGIRILWLRLRRPRLAAGVLSGALMYLLLLFISSMSGRLRFILSWDAGVLVAMALLMGLRRALPDTMKRIAAQQDAGKWTVLFLTLIAASASLVAVAAEVPLIRNAGEFEKIVRISLIIATIVLSWAFIHTHLCAALRARLLLQRFQRGGRR